MKTFLKILIPLLFCFTANSQSITKLTGDTTIANSNNGATLFQIKNNTAYRTGGYLQNYLQGRTKWNYAIDSVWVGGGNIYFARATHDTTVISLSSATVGWGNITGTLSAQTDLQNALNAKLSNINGLVVAGSGIGVTGSGTAISPYSIAFTGTVVTSVSGTANRITSTGGTTPVIDISSTFEGLLGKVANPLSQFAATTSAQLAGVISDESGTNKLMYSDGGTMSNTLLTNTTLGGITTITASYNSCNCIVALGQDTLTGRIYRKTALISAVTSVAPGYGLNFTTITGSGSVISDTFAMATRARVQKPIDSLDAAIVAGYVPVTRTVAGFALSSNVTLASLTIGTGLTLSSGTTYNGSTALTLSAGDLSATYWALSGSYPVAGSETGSFLGSINNVSLRIRSNNVEVAKFDSTGSELYLENGLNPLISLKQKVTSKEWQIRGNLGNGSSSQNFNIYDATNSKIAINIADYRHIAFGNVTAIPTSSQIYGFGGSAGANLDMRPDSLVSDDANIEVENAAYDDGSSPFLGFGLAIEHSGNKATGNTFVYSNKNLSQLRFTATTNLIKVINNASLRFGTNSTEYMVLDSNGRLGIGNKLPTYTLDVTGTSRITSTFYLSGNTYNSGAALVGLAIDTLTGIVYRKTASGGSGVTSVASGFGTSFSTITSTGTVVADSTSGGVLSWVRGKKIIDSLGVVIATKGTGSVTSVASGFGTSFSTITTTGTIVGDSTSGGVLSWVRGKKIIDSLVSVGSTAYIQNQNGLTLSSQTAKFFISDTIKTSASVIATKVQLISGASSVTLGAFSTAIGSGPDLTIGAGSDRLILGPSFAVRFPSATVEWPAGMNWSMGGQSMSVSGLNNLTLQTQVNNINVLKGGYNQDLFINAYTGKNIYINGTGTANGDGSVNIGTTVNTASSGLTVSSTTRGSIPAPVMTQTQRDAISSPATGLSVYNSTNNTDDVYNSSAWVSNAIWGYASKSADYTATSTDYTIEVTATGKTITLPTAVGISGRVYTIKLTASGSGTVGTTSSQTIDGSTTYSLSAQYKYVTVQSTNANWIVIANN